LPVGAVWLLLSRLGMGPRGFSALTVFLAALHFHFSGFTLQILIASTTRQLRARGSRALGLHRGLAVAAILGIPAIAAGNLAALPALKLAGVFSIVLSAFSLALTSSALARALPPSPPRRLLLLSAASLASGMLLAGIYGAGEILGAGWIGVPRMVTTHGILNALGFTQCGLVAHLMLSARSLELPSDETPG
jgi:hypothetical protein